MKTILHCNCVHYPDLVPHKIKAAVKTAVDLSDVTVIEVPDLCGLAAGKDPALLEFGEIEDLVVLACNPRAVRWLFHAGGASLGEKKINIVNLRSATEADIAALFGAIPKGSPARRSVAGKTDDWTPWFPAIDYSRCVNCKQCLSFCLFGVYEQDEKGRMIVRNPRNCKTNCPACSRICPEVAIIFSKCAEAPINGAEIADETVARANVKVNMDKILGSDPYKALAERRKQAKKNLVDRTRLPRD